METAVRWSPSSTLSEQRFLIVDVKDRSFKRCKVSQYNGKSFKHETLSTYSTVPGFRAFDWAPQNENLVAVGSWSGEVSILHIDDSLPNISLPAKRQRLCNAVAFSRTGLLAAGLEGVRNDFCLNLWDVNQRPPTVSSSGGGSSKPFVEPYRRFASSEAISSIKFFTSQPDVFVAGIKGKGVRIYDLRENSGNPSLIFKTDCVFNIAIDPLDENYFACAGHPEDRTIQIWDSRRGTPYSAAMTGSSSDLGAQVEKPVLEYRDVFRPQKGSLKKFDGTGVMISTIWSLRYCKGKSGCLGVLASTGNFKVYETKHGYSPATEHKIPEQPDHEVTSNNDHAMLTKRIHQIEHACDDIRHGRPEKERIVAFDFTNLASKKGTPSVIILGGDHTVNIIELDGAPSSLGVSSLGDLVVTKPHQSNSRLRSRTDEDYFLDNALQMFAPREEGNIADSTVQVRQNQTDTTSQDSGAKIVAQNISLSSHELLEKLLGDQTSGARLRLEDGLAISTITRRRCLEGYLFNCKRNREIMHEEPRLQRLWSWIDRSKSANDKESMATDTLDLSFFGVASIWNNDLDSQRASNRSSKPTYSKEVAIAVETLCDRLHLPEFRMTESAVPNHRRLCLYTCGLGLSLATLDILVNDLVRQGQNTKAAVLGIIHDQVGLAFQALRNGNTSPANRELSLALAAYNKGTTNALWQETTRELGNGLDDPYARAILTFVRSGDWHDVLAESSLPLRDTVGIALMYLDDTELTQYINSKLAASIKNGNIDGIVLTGLTEQAVRLFETYIRKYSDLQTAVLAMSFTCPRYFTDLRVDLWRETYRSYLNNWGKLYERAHFDVQSATLCTAPNQKPELRIMPRQLTLLCNYCDQSLDCNSINAPPPTAPTTHGTHPEKIFGNDKTDTKYRATRMPDTGASHGRSTNHTHTTQFSEFESSSHDECTETSRISENEPEPPTIPGSGPVTRSNVKVAWYLDGLMARLKHPLGPDTAEYDDFPFPDIQEAHEDDPEEEVLDEEDSEGSEWEDFDQEWRELQDLHSRIMNGIEEINEIALSRPLISAPEASASSEAVPGAEAPKEQAMPVGWSKDELKQMYAVKKRMVRHLVAWHSLREKTLNSFKGSRARLGNGFRKGDGVEG